MLQHNIRDCEQVSEFSRLASIYFMAPQGYVNILELCQVALACNSPDSVTDFSLPLTFLDIAWFKFPSAQQIIFQRRDNLLQFNNPPRAQKITLLNLEMGLFEGAKVRLRGLASIELGAEIIGVTGSTRCNLFV